MIWTETIRVYIKCKAKERKMKIIYIYIRNRIKNKELLVIRKEGRRDKKRTKLHDVGEGTDHDGFGTVVSVNKHE